MLLSVCLYISMYNVHACFYYYDYLYTQIYSSIDLGCYPFLGSGSVVVDFLFIVSPIVGVCNCSMFSIGGLGCCQF